MEQKTAHEMALLVLERLEEQMPKNADEVQKIKRELSRTYACKKFPSNIEILCYGTADQYRRFRTVLSLKPTRTLSGVTPIAVMAKPLSCPHGKCIFCPGGIDSYFGTVPQSYTGKEPSTMRAMRAGYDPYLIVFNRLEQYIVTGHEVDKIDIIIQSGTFCSFPKRYRDELITLIYKALNDFSKLFYAHGELDVDLFKAFFDLPADMKDAAHTKRVQDRIRRFKMLDVAQVPESLVRSVAHDEIGSEAELADYAAALDLDAEIGYNDLHAIAKCIGMTIETKPDWGRKKHGVFLRRYGVTRVELGIQSVYDDVLDFSHRGHSTQDSIDSIRELRDMGFKLNFHYMPGLTSYERDFEGMKQLFSDPNYRPDMLKIYPCMVMPGTELERLYKEGAFTPMGTDTAVKMIADIMAYVEPYCRIMRVQRDIPTMQTTAGVDRTNLRQMVDDYMKQHGITTREIRANESGRTKTAGEPALGVLEYAASHGKEFFISFADNDTLFGFCRLRFPSDNTDAAYVRELHVYGKALRLHAGQETGSAQHKGLGRQLMVKAEELAKKYKKRKLLIISGVGVRAYYRRLGYALEDTYMVKTL